MNNEKDSNILKVCIEFIQGKIPWWYYSIIHEK